MAGVYPARFDGLFDNKLLVLFEIGRAAYVRGSTPFSRKEKGV